MDTRVVESRLSKAGIGAFFRPRDLRPLGITHWEIQALVTNGAAEKLGRGLYRLNSVEPTEMETVAMVAAATPGAVICLLTALRVHEIGTQLPHEVWIAIGGKARKPSNPPASVRVVRFSEEMLGQGVVKQTMQGVCVSVTSPARTVVDCFRYRNKIGLDVGMEALRDAFLSRKATMDEIWRAAEVSRIRTVIRPYLESLSS